MTYDDLSDEDKIRQSIEFVAIGHAIPKSLADFLKEINLYELIVNPGEVVDE